MSRRWKVPRIRGIFTEFYDPHGRRFGLPTYPFHCAPDGLYTLRQLRDKGLRQRQADEARENGSIPGSAVCHSGITRRPG